MFFPCCLILTTRLYAQQSCLLLFKKLPVFTPRSSCFGDNVENHSSQIHHIFCIKKKRENFSIGHIRVISSKHPHPHKIKEKESIELANFGP